MSKIDIKIESILGGMSPSQYFSVKNGYDSAIGIDPDLSIGSNVKTAGMLTPSLYQDFTDTALDGDPMWLITNSENTNVYAYCDNGAFLSYNAALATETDLTAPTSGAGNGAAFYNNYIYLGTPTNISRYGPMDGSPVIAQNVWTSAVLGTQTALSNATYPTIRGVKIPNHAMHVHPSNNVLYVCDFAVGQGLLHQIETKKTSVLGDTDNGSDYGVIDLPFGFYPTDVESYGSYVVISAIQTLSATSDQGHAALFFWDTNAESFYNRVDLADPLVTALMNVNGILYIFSGNSQKGFRISKYIGGDSVMEEAYFEDGYPPFAGAVEAIGSKMLFGTDTSYPETSASVISFGSKRADLPQKLHNIIRSNADGTTPRITSLKKVQQDSNSEVKVIVGWGDAGDYGIDKSGTGTLNSVWRSELFKINREFTIEDIRIPLGTALAANMEIVPKLIMDDGVSTKTLQTINTTNYTAGTRKIIYKPQEVFEDGAEGINNFILELNWGETVTLPVLLPIEISINIKDDESND